MPTITALHSNRLTTLACVSVSVVIYVASLFVLAQRPDFSLIEPLFVLVVLGGVFSSLVWALTRSAARALPEQAAPSSREVLVAIGYVGLFAVVVLGWGFTQVKASVTAQPAQSIVLTITKLVTMVAIPLLLLRALRYRWADLRQRFQWRRHGGALLVMALVLLAFQAVFGRGLKTLGELGPDAATLVWAIPACFVWQCIEAGLCEEVLFRMFLQQRLADRLRSNLAAVPIAALLFGLAHAPGLYLRGANAMEGVSEVTVGWAIAYSLAVIAPAGLLFGTLWARTRCLWLVVILHGLMDTLPGLAGFIQEWR